MFFFFLLKIFFKKKNNPTTCKTPEEVLREPIEEFNVNATGSTS